MNKMEKKLSNITEVIFTTISLLIFIILAILVITNNTKWLDEYTFNLISSFRNDLFTIIFKSITFFCSIEFILFFTLGMLIFSKRNGKTFTINIIGCVLINQLLKHFFARSRPIDINLISESGYSFPSGHSMMSVAFYGFFIYLILKSKLNKKQKIIFCTLLSLLILLIGLSRIYLGVHYTSDVIAGFACATIYLIIFKKIYIQKKR